MWSRGRRLRPQHCGPAPTSRAGHLLASCLLAGRHGGDHLHAHHHRVCSPLNLDAGGPAGRETKKTPAAVRAGRLVVCRARYRAREGSRREDENASSVHLQGDDDDDDAGRATVSPNSRVRGRAMDEGRPWGQAGTVCTEKADRATCTRKGDPNLEARHVMFAGLRSVCRTARPRRKPAHTGLLVPAVLWARAARGRSSSSDSAQTGIEIFG
jgi:hypothetical protein